MSVWILLMNISISVSSSYSSTYRMDNKNDTENKITIERMQLRNSIKSQLKLNQTLQLFLVVGRIYKLSNL